jgi:glycosyltransferase involved in cell wall biosynthesis
LLGDRAKPVDPIVLTVTRLSAAEPYKNVDQVIRATARLAAEIPSITLEIVGEGDARQGLERLALKEGVRERVRFLGRLSDEELAAAYARASIFALPSTREGFGIAYLEAWQRRLPVVGSTEGAAPEVITDGVDGLLVPGGDVPATVDALRALIRDPELRNRLGAAGHAKTTAQYSGTAFRQNLSEILDVLLRGAGRERARAPRID